MRTRAFIPAGEQVRPFSEVRAEREAGSLRERTLDEIARLERGALEARTETERQALQCQAEDLRCALQGV